MSSQRENRTPAWLKRLRVTKVALVDTAANEHAYITLYKRKEKNVITNTGQSQSLIFEAIQKKATRQFPELTEPQAIDRYTSEVPEGQALARAHSEAVVDYEPQEVHQIVEKAGGSQAELVAKRLDDAAKEYALTHNIGHEAAYDIVLGTAEGMELRQKYDRLMRG